jgi:hypothetical protein
MAAVNMDAHQALCRFYSISFLAGRAGADHGAIYRDEPCPTLNLLHQYSEEALHVINPFVPQSIRRRSELDEK